MATLSHTQFSFGLYENLMRLECCLCVLIISTIILDISELAYLWSLASIKAESCFELISSGVLYYIHTSLVSYHVQISYLDFRLDSSQPIRIGMTQIQFQTWSTAPCSRTSRRRVISTFSVTSSAGDHPQQAAAAASGGVGKKLPQEHRV